MTLHIARGEMVALIGRNGSGKSTLLKLLIGLLLPTQGSISIDGLVLSRRTVWSFRDRISLVFQDPDDQLVAGRVGDEVAFGPENLGVPTEELSGRVEVALEAVGLGDLRDCPVEELTPGQKQRLAIADALAMRPLVLALDEPTTFLTVPAARRLIGLLGDIRSREGTSVLHVTHSMWEAAHFDRVVVLHSGRIALEGTPAEVFEQIDTLRSLGLETPLATSIAASLRRSGIPLRHGILNARVLCDALAEVAESRPGRRP